MTRRIPLWLALAGCLGGLAIGRGVAQAPEKPEPEPPALTEYPYLPNRYGEAYIPSVAEWQALRVTSLGASTTRLTEEFSRQHLTCFATPKGLVMTLDLAPQPKWKFAVPGGKFNVPAERVKPDLQKAVDMTMRFVRNFFSEVRDEHVVIQLFINSERVGVWQNDTLTLNGEMPAQAK